MDKQKGLQPQGFGLSLFYVACAITALLGGSSRYDLVQVVPLQVGSWLVVAVAAFRYRSYGFGQPLVVLATLYAAWLALQIVPLPHAIWTSLPGRAPLEELEEALAIHTARPFSMMPDRTLNALGSFGAVMAPLLAALNLGPAVTRHACIAICALGLASALLAISQVLAGTPYLYAITNPGSPVGLFANANHASVLSPIVLILLALMARLGNRQMQIGAACVGLLLVVSVLINPSRAGLVSLLIALATIALLWGQPRAIASGAALNNSYAGIGIVLFALAFLALGLLFASSRGLPALAGLVEADPLGDLRFAIMPTLTDMVLNFAPLGSGVGSFETVYYGFEERELIRRTYVNMAHNDVLQVMIEGGVVILAFLAATAWIAFRSARKAIAQHRHPLSIAIASIAITMILVLASAVDYPLRVPAFQMVATLLMVMLVAAARDQRVVSDSGTD